MLDKSSRHTASDMLEGDKYLQLDLQERMEVGCRWQADVPRGVCRVRFEKCNPDGSGRLNQDSSAIGWHCKACKPVLFQLQLAQPQRGARRLFTSRKLASCSVPCARFSLVELVGARCRAFTAMCTDSAHTKACAWCSWPLSA